MRQADAPLALLAGLAAALLQLAGALKTAPPLAALPFDLTLAALALLLPLLLLLGVTRRWQLDASLGLPLAAAALLAAWLVVAASWTASREVAAAKLPEVVLGGPLMLVTGLAIGAEPSARRALVAGSLLIGVAVAAFVGWALTGNWALQAAMAPEQAKVHHQLAGLAMAIAAGLGAVRAVESRHPIAAIAWLALVIALAAAAMVPGGRTALLALGASVVLAPALRLWLGARKGAAAAWCALALGAGLVGAAVFLLDPSRAAGLRTLERLSEEAGGLEARLGLWTAALDWAGEAAPLGLGTGGFSIAAGYGERRGLYPHNHGLEALAEAGLPGLILWLLAFGGGIAAACRLMGGAGGDRSARIAAMVLPVALTVMVSTDLGNRMAWFALGLALSLGVTARSTAPLRQLQFRHV